MRQIAIATEDELSETLLCKVLGRVAPDCEVHLKLGKRGNGYLQTKMQNFCQMARLYPVIVLTDLDDLPCPPTLVANWCNGLQLPDNLFLRVAVREIEAWVMADLEGFARLLGVATNKLNPVPDSIADAKAALMLLARHANRDIRNELLPARGSTSSQGIGYNRTLCDFVANSWSLDAAAERSESLARTMARLAAV
jgi:hypothetical protein